MRKVVWVSVLLALTATTAAIAATTADRETVLDRRVHIEKEILAVPEIGPLCDQIKGLKREDIDAGGCKLYCEQEGKGTPIVMIAGGPGCTHHLFHPHFSQAAKYARVIYYDQRGVGQSGQDPTNESYTIRQAVEDLECLRKALKIDKWVVLGHSYGGLLAQCYALEHPERLMGLVLICSATGTPGIPLKDTRQYDYMTAEEIAKVRSIREDDRLTDEQKLYNAHLNGDWKRQDFYRPTNDKLARMARYEWKPAPGFRERICPDMNRTDLAGKFEYFDVPTLIVEARRDLTWNTDKAETMLKNHPGAKMIVFENSAHSPFGDETDRFFSVLGDFIGSAKTSSAPSSPSTQTIGWGKAQCCKADNLLQKGDYYAAADLYRQVLQKLPASPKAKMGLKKIAALEVELKRILAKAQTNYDLGDESLKALLQAEKLDIRDGMVWLQIGTQLCVAGHYKEALSAMDRFPIPVPAVSAMGDAWKGIALDALGRRQEAVQAYTRSLRIVGSDDRCDTPWFTINRDWLQQRLTTPFSSGMIHR